MTRLLAWSIVCCLAASALAQTDSLPDEPDAAGLAPLVRRIEAAAKDAIEGKGPDRQLELSLKAVVYQGRLLEDLKVQLQAPRPDRLVNLYVVNKLLQPVLWSEDETIREVYPIVKRLHVAMRKYRQFSEPMPADGNANTPASQPADKAAAAELRRQRKLRHSQQILFHNQQTHALEKKLFAMIMLLPDGSQDEYLLQLLASAEKEGLSVWIDALEAVRSAAKSLPVDRAEKLYDRLQHLAEPLLNERKDYLDPSDADIRPDGDGTFKSVRQYPGVKIMEAVNQLAVAAHKPALIVPDQKAIDKQKDGAAPAAKRPKSTKTKAPPRQ